MGVASSYNSGDERGVAGFHEDLQTANKISPCFRYEGSQLFFTSLSPTNLADATFRYRGLVGVKRVKGDGTDALPGGGFKTLSYRQFQKVLKRMQAEADVALQAQMALRGWIEPDREHARRILMEDGTIVSMEEARATGVLAPCPPRSSRASPETRPWDGPSTECADPRLERLEGPPPPECSVSAQGIWETTANMHSNFEDALGVEASERRVREEEEEQGESQEIDTLLDDSGREFGARRAVARIPTGAATFQVGLGQMGGDQGRRQESGAALASGEGSDICPVGERISDGAQQSVRQNAGRSMDHADIKNSQDCHPYVGEGLGYEGRQRQGQDRNISVAHGSQENGDMQQLDCDDHVVGRQREDPGERAGDIRLMSESATSSDAKSEKDGGALADSSQHRSDKGEEEEGLQRYASHACGQEDGDKCSRHRVPHASEAGEEEEGNTPSSTKLAFAETRLAKNQRQEYECMICLQTTGSGISLPCLHGPFCEGCLSVWRKTGYDDDDCWVHLEEPELKEIVEGLYGMIRRL